MAKNPQYKIRVKDILKWIEELLSKYDPYRKPVIDLKFNYLPKYFLEETLRKSSVIYCDDIPLIPLHKFGLLQLSMFESKSFIGMTYLNSFFIKNGNKENESLHFHELLHILQWKYLGPERFINDYASGLLKHNYNDNPLEKMVLRYQKKFEKSEMFNAERKILEEIYSTS